MKAVLIHNPSAGMRTDYPGLHAAVQVLVDAGWDATIQETLASGDACALARDAARGGCDAVLAVGGDGTVNEVANGLVGTTAALGVLPYGTANVWAKEMGLPLGALSNAARLLVQAQPRCIDVGQAEGKSFAPRVFVLWCGVGFDAQITEEIEPQRALKRQLGAIMFWLVGVRAAFTFRGRRAQVRVDGKKRRFRILLALASNAQLYGGIVRVSPQARIDDGLLDLVVFPGTGAVLTAWHLLRVLLGWHLSAPDVIHYRGRDIAIRASGLPVHVDGEPVGRTPVRISIRPRALYVLVPPTANKTLFKEEG